MILKIVCLILRMANNVENQKAPVSWFLLVTEGLKSLCYLYQILAVSGLHQRFCKLKKLFLIDKALAVAIF